MIFIYWVNLIFFIFCAFYFVFRRFDLFSLSFFSVFLYYFPLLFFFDFNQHIYFCVFVVNLMLVVFSFFSSSRFILDKDSFPQHRLLLIFFISLILFSFNFVFSSSGSSKSEASVSIFYYLFLTPLFLTLVSSFVLDKKWLFFLTMGVYVFFLLTGDRTQIIIAAIGVVYIYLNENCSSFFNFIKRYPILFILFILLFFIFGFLGKAIYGAYFDYILGRDFISSFLERVSIFFSSPSSSIESFHTLSIFEFVANNGDYIGWDYLYHIPAQILPVSLNTGVDSHFIPDYVKMKYFSDWSDGAGVSSNFFMEGVLSFGEYGYIIFSFIYVLGVAFFSFFTKFSNFYFKVWGLYGGIFWSFYIHRSSLFQMIAHQKRIFYSLVIMFFIISIFMTIRRRMKI